MVAILAYIRGMAGYIKSLPLRRGERGRVLGFVKGLHTDAPGGSPPPGTGKGLGGGEPDPSDAAAPTGSTQAFGRKERASYSFRN